MPIEFFAKVSVFCFLASYVVALGLDAARLLKRWPVARWIGLVFGLAGLCSAVGVCLGILVHTALAALGVGAILQASETLFLLLKLAGAGYLVYLGLRMMLSRDVTRIDTSARARLSPLSLVWQGMLSNVTNPKIVLFFFAFLPQFVDLASAHPTRDLVFLGVLYALLALPVKAGVALAAGGFSERVLGNHTMGDDPGLMRLTGHHRPFTERPTTSRSAGKAVAPSAGPA